MPPGGGWSIIDDCFGPFQSLHTLDEPGNVLPHVVDGCAFLAAVVVADGLRDQGRLSAQAPGERSTFQAPEWRPGVDDVRGSDGEPERVGRTRGSPGARSGLRLHSSSPVNIMQYSPEFSQVQHRDAFASQVTRPHPLMQYRRAISTTPGPGSRPGRGRPYAGRSGQRPGPPGGSPWCASRRNRGIHFHFHQRGLYQSPPCTPYPVTPCNITGLTGGCTSQNSPTGYYHSPNAASMTSNADPTDHQHSGTEA